MEPRRSYATGLIQKLATQVTRKPGLRLRLVNRRGSRSERGVLAHMRSCWARWPAGRARCVIAERAWFIIFKFELYIFD